MHDCRVSADRSPKDIVGVGEVDYDDLILFIDLFAYANEVVGF